MPHDYANCAAQHFGPWLIEPQWFHQALAAIKAGLYVVPQARGAGVPAIVAGPGYREPDRADLPPVGLFVGDERPPRQDEKRLYGVTEDGIAVLELDGPLVKGDSSFGGTSTVRTRKAIRQAVADPGVSAMLLLVDSPGGTVAGTQELAADVAAANRQKPIYAHVTDLGASAAYWITSQARRVTATPTATVGSIGTVAVVEDTSGLAQATGVVVHVIAATGAPYKGAFAGGAPITPDQLVYLQEMVDGLNGHFTAAVKTGRRLTDKTLAAVTTGRLWIAGEALALKLIDAVASTDEAVAGIRRDLAEQTKQAQARQGLQGLTGKR